ncbi:MAG TPA: LamG domain-containing protein [Vicinamibacterales bacterium]|nr:LamG domain-containing protein [Vicinamibacterales bacterium]
MNAGFHARRQRLIRPLTSLGGLAGAVLVLVFAPTIHSDAHNCATTPSGLVGGWDGDSVSGTTAIDISPFDNDGILSGSVQIVPGLVGNAFSFNGSFNTRVSGVFVDGFTGGNVPITLAAWFNQPAPPVGHPGQGILAVGNAGFKAHFFQRLSTGVGALNTTYVCLNGVVGPNRLCIGADDGADRWWPSNAVITNSAWHFIVNTYDPVTNQVGIHVDGQLDHTVTVAGGLSLGTEFWIGGDAYNDNFFVGLIDEAQVYNRVLGASEIHAIFDAGSAGVCKLATVCHKPGTPGERTMVLPAHAVPGHMGHGDTAGACSSSRPLR